MSRCPHPAAVGTYLADDKVCVKQPDGSSTVRPLMVYYPTRRTKIHKDHIVKGKVEF